MNIKLWALNTLADILGSLSRACAWLAHELVVLRHKLLIKSRELSL